MVTTTGIVAAVCISAFGMINVIEAAVVDVGASTLPPKVTVLAWVNPVPVIVSVKLYALT